MALTDLQRLRLAIADRHRVSLDETIGIGDSNRVLFKTHLSPIVEDSQVITIDWEGQTDETDYTIDFVYGLVTFTAAPEVTRVVRATYKWSVFSDEELNDLLTLKGAVVPAAITALEWVMADVDRWMRYFFGQEMVDRSAGVEAIRRLMESIRQSAGAPSGIVRATTTALEEAMSPFIEQEEDLFV